MSALARRATHARMSASDAPHTSLFILTYTLPTGDLDFAQRATRFFFAARAGTNTVYIIKTINKM